jgi:hypothetical protein
MNFSERQRGFSTTEWVALTFWLLLALFVPFGDNPSAVAMFLQAVRDFHANASFPLSLP